MPVNLDKVTKKITKKKGGRVGSLHENSRDTQALRKASARHDRLERAAALVASGRETLINRVVYFQGQTPESLVPVPEKSVLELISQYINRYDLEIAELEASLRKGRLPPKRLENLKEAKRIEEREFETGFWTPDLTDATNTKRLKAWNGEWSAMSAISFVRWTRDGKKQASGFPPK